MVTLFDTTTCDYTYSADYSQLNGWSMFGCKFTGTGSDPMTGLQAVTISACKKNEAGGLTGTMQLKILDTDGSTVLATGSSLDVDNLNTFPEYSDHTFTIASTNVAQGQYVVITFPTGTNSTNCLFWARSNTANNCADPYISGYYTAGSNYSTTQLAHMVGATESPTPPSSGAVLLPPPIAVLSL